MPLFAWVSLGLWWAQAGAAADAPTPRAAPETRVLVLGVQGKGGVPEDAIRQTNVLLAQALSAHAGYRVSTPDDVAQVAGLMRERQLIGGAEGDLARLVDAAKEVNADVLLTGTLARSGGALVLTVQRVEVGSVTVRGDTRTFKQLKEVPALVETMLAAIMRFPQENQKAQFHLPQGKKTSFAVMDLTASGVPADVTANLTQVLSAEIKKADNTSVLSRADIQAMLQMEATRSLAGCDQESCLAELGGALGVDKLVAGSVGRLGDSYVVSLRLIAVRDVTVENRATESFTGPEEQLIHAMRQTARNLLGLQVVDRGMLNVTASQAGAQVYLDGQQAGLIPVPPFEGLKVGAHTVEIEKPGFTRWVGDTYVHPNETTPLWVKLQALPPRFYQRPVFWLAMLGGGGAVIAVTVGTVALASLASVVLLRLYTNPSPPASGTATVTGLPAGGAP